MNIGKKAFLCAGSIETGSIFRFSMPPDFEVIEKVIKSSEDVKMEGMPETEAMIIFSCIGRLSCLGPLLSEEIIGLQSTWDVPVIGFFTFGEFGRIKNSKTNYHSATVSWVVLKEKVT